jgi:nucleotide-binding universal stress UspA family protein
MFERIIVGVDGRDGGRDALALAGRIVRHTGAALVAVRAYPYEAHHAEPVFVGYHEKLRADTRAAVERDLAEAGVAARVLVVAERSPARALHDAAEEQNAGLIVVGSSDHAAFGRVLAGDVATSTLHHAPCPVAIVPRGYATSNGGLGTLAVGFDGGDEAVAALRFAADLATACGAGLEIRTVVGTAVPAAFPNAYEESWIEAAERSGREQADQAMRLAEELGAPAVAEVTVGSPIDELVELSREADAMIVGSRGWGPVRRVLLGSTADRLARRAAAPVLVVPRPVAGQAEREPAPSASAHA